MAKECKKNPQGDTSGRVGGGGGGGGVHSLAKPAREQILYLRAAGGSPHLAIQHKIFMGYHITSF